MSSHRQTDNFRGNAAPASSICARQTAKKTENKKVHIQPLVSKLGFGTKEQGANEEGRSLVR